MAVAVAGPPGPPPPPAPLLAEQRDVLSQALQLVVTKVQAAQVEQREDLHGELPAAAAGRQARPGFSTHHPHPTQWSSALPQPSSPAPSLLPPTHLALHAGMPAPPPTPLPGATC